jgi:hypothetical protein
MVVKATLHKLRIAEVPTTLARDGRSRPPHLRSWRDGWRHLRFLLLFSPAWLFLYPGFALLLLGIVAMAWLLPEPRVTGGVTLDVNTLVFTAAAIVCGFQATSFYVFAKTFAIRSGLLPEDPLVTRLREVLRLEIGLIVGSIMVVLGLALAAYAVGFWKVRAFGRLDPQHTLRIVVPAATLLILGLQVMFSSCLLSILQLESPAAGSAASQRRTFASGTALRADPDIR